MHQLNDTQGGPFALVTGTLGLLRAHPPLFLLAQSESVVSGRRLAGVFIVFKIRQVRVVIVIWRRIGKGESAVCKFDKSNAEGPYIRFNRVFGTLYTFRLHRLSTNLVS